MDGQSKDGLKWMRHFANQNWSLVNAGGLVNILLAT